MGLPVYLDYNATTPVDPRVVEAMLPYFTTDFGNAASRQHAFGWRAAEAVERARRQLASAIGADPREIVLTSGATESDNLAIKGVVRARGAAGAHVITAVTEHKAVLDSCARLEGEGTRVTYLPVDRRGLVDPEAVSAAITPDTVLVTIMAANNEIGVGQPIAEIAKIARARGVLFHTDAVQAVGKIPFDVEALGVDLASFTAHKMYGPKGAGALYVRRRPDRVALAPLFDGGGHEHGLRPGTLNVPAIVGFGAAAELAVSERPAESARLASLRDELWRRLSDRLDGISLNGPDPGVAGLPHTLNVAVAGVDGPALMLHLDDVAVSSGAACTSAAAAPSHVLSALGLPADLARASIRFSLGRYTTREEIAYAAEKVASVVTQLRRGADPFALDGDAERPEWSVT